MASLRNNFYPGYVLQESTDRLCQQVPWDYLTKKEQKTICSLCIICSDEPPKEPGKASPRATEEACKHGHPWTEDSTIIRENPKSGNTYKVCRICMYQNQKRYERRKRLGIKRYPENL